MESQERRCFLLRFHSTGGKGKSGTVGEINLWQSVPFRGTRRGRRKLEVGAFKVTVAAEKTGQSEEDA